MRLATERTDGLAWSDVEAKLLPRVPVQAAILEALERDAPHPNAVRRALERHREQQGDPPPVAITLPDHVRARDAPVQPHALEPYDKLKEPSDD